MPGLGGENLAVDARCVRKPSGAAQLHGILQSRIAHGGLGGGHIGWRRAVKVPTTAPPVLREAPVRGPGCMRIVFVHRTVNDYTVETPYLRGIGGTESALAIFRSSWRSAGHAVSLLTSTSSSGALQERRVPELQDQPDARSDQCGRRGRGLERGLRASAEGRIPRQEAARDVEPACRRSAGDRGAGVHARAQGVGEHRVRQRVAARPVLQRLLGRPREDARHAQRDLARVRIGDTGAPVVSSRAGSGARLHERALSRARRAARRGPDHPFGHFGHAPARLLGHGDASSRDRERSVCRALSARCRSTEGVDYIGPVPQPELAAELSRAAALAYPSTFPETSCIAAMEAMSAGAIILTTRSGAMPETTAGFGLMIEPHEDDPRLAKEFAQMAIDALAEARREPELAEVRRSRADRVRAQELLLAGTRSRMGIVPVRGRAAELLATRRAS